MDDIICFRSSKRSIQNVLKGFFKDKRHLDNQFAYMTGAEPLTDRVQDNMRTQFGMAYILLLH